MSLSPTLTAAVDQEIAHTTAGLEAMLATVREMQADGVDPTEQVTMVALAVWQGISDPATMAGLAATAIVRLAHQQPTQGRPGCRCTDDYECDGTGGDPQSGRQS